MNSQNNKMPKPVSNQKITKSGSPSPKNPAPPPVRKPSSQAVKRPVSPPPRKVAPPLVRRPVKQTPQPKLKRKNARARRQRFTAVLFLFLTLYLLISLLAAGFIYFSFEKESKSDDVYALQLNLVDKKMFSFEALDVNNIYGLYIPFEKLSTLCGLSIAGDSDNVIILLSKDGGTIKCTNNSSLVYINENAVRLSAPVLFETNDYMIPIDLVESYLIGVIVSYDQDKMLCTVSASADSDEITLKMQMPSETSKVYFPEDFMKDESNESNS